MFLLITFSKLGATTIAFFLVVAALMWEMISGYLFRESIRSRRLWFSVPGPDVPANALCTLLPEL